jgi:hypothetical protein
MIQKSADLGKRSGATGIRTPDLLHAIHNAAAAGHCLTSPHGALTWIDPRQVMPGVARRLWSLAPILAPRIPLARLNSLLPGEIQESAAPVFAAAAVSLPDLPCSSAASTGPRDRLRRPLW